MIRSLLRLSLVCLVLVTLAACGGSQADAEQQEGEKAQEAAAGQAETPAGSPPALAQPPAPGDTAANVNGTAITRAELESAMTAFLRSQGMQGAPPPEQVGMIRSRVLEALIGRELIYQLGVKQGITPPAGQVEAAMAQVKQPYSTEEAWQAQLSQQGMTDEGVREMLHRNLSIDEVIKQSVTGKGQVSNADIRKYYDEHPNEMQRPEEVQASHILFRVEQGATPEVKAGLRGKAESVLAQIRGGADFAEMARQHSQDPGSAAKGGDLGYLRRGMTVPPFDAVVFSLEPGKISDVVETGFGFHIIKVTGRRDAGLMPFDEVSASLGEFLKQKQSEEMMKELIDSLKAEAAIQIF